MAMDVVSLNETGKIDKPRFLSSLEPPYSTAHICKSLEHTQPARRIGPTLYLNWHANIANVGMPTKVQCVTYVEISISQYRVLIGMPILLCQPRSNVVRMLESPLSNIGI